jgi:hypothetical protein
VIGKLWSPNQSTSSYSESFTANNDEEPIHDINSICEGMGCSAEATLKVPVKVGEMGTIILLLCDKCRLRFPATTKR